jgi:hypothetical protein
MSGAHLSLAPCFRPRASSTSSSSNNSEEPLSHAKAVAVLGGTATAGLTSLATCLGGSLTAWLEGPAGCMSALGCDFSLQDSH